ncbi:MAG: S8 family peptidase [Gammaproteobacteria bacterium]|nr:S8 family peptidase [Gammaproteobacteria bacterium]NNF48348.1 S8 family peptidase [Woeseiaceae bacterium]MBT8094304.1 S8 family peptidase [Gammaproteobacteria bacterium]MBT8105997.1 S8 family peptidase [Gammaproteobacteria bacterium]NNK26011.1 S8 family peptidase [Woeseiaceae bacterium]
MTTRFSIAVLAVLGFAMGIGLSLRPAPVDSYIVQGVSVADVRALVIEQGGKITHELGVIRAVAADLTAGQIADLRRHENVRRIYDNGAIEAAAKGGKKNTTGGDTTSGDTTGDGTTDTSTATDTFYTTLVNGDAVHQMGIDGTGIGIAVLDTGLWKTTGIRYDSAGNTRIKAVYNAMTDQVAASPLSGDDPAGHGSHVASIAVSSLITADGTARYNGVAPGAHLVSVQAFDENGQGTYADVIRAIDWIVANKSKHKIRILNASFSAEARSHYWDDPINQAIMVAWRSAIFVVAAAGNRGPQAMTIGVPGNVPYVMTVGAMTDSFTPSDPSDDKLASFSSAGPTYEGFMKPEVVAPGGHMRGLVQNNATLATAYPEYYDGDYFEMSGTSQATAVVSGIAALALQAEPWRSVDELKCKIMSAAKPATITTGKGGNKTTTLAYSVFQQGAGQVDAYATVMNQTIDCANNGLHIDNDIDGTQHFGGRANQDVDGAYFLMGLDGYMWTNGYQWTDGTLWTDGYQWTDGYMWTDGYQWTDGSVGIDGYMWTGGDGLSTDGYQWTDGGLSTNGYMWTGGLTEMATMSTWVEPE